MMTHTESATDYLRATLENMVALGMLARENGIKDVTAQQLVAAEMQRILKSAERSLPLARVLDNSDIVFHAEGPGVSHDMPALSALGWLTTTVERGLRFLSSATIELMGASDAGSIARRLDMRLSGFAPGSLYIGAALAPPDADLFPQDIESVSSLRAEIARLPGLLNYIDADRINPAVSEVAPDPAMRDVAFEVLLKMAPSNKRNIHSIGLSSREFKGTLSQRERTVIRHSLSNPANRPRKQGSFTGEVREADLDKSRVHLRTQDGVIRCIVSGLSAEQARTMLGKTAKVSGHYETDRQGRPRLLYVTETAVIKRPVQQTLNTL